MRLPPRITNVLLTLALTAASGSALLQAQTSPAPVRAIRSFARGSGLTGLPASTVVALHTDREGTIWIATFDGLARVEHGAVERVPVAKAAPSSGPIFRVIDRRAGGVLVSGNQGLHAFDGTQWTLIQTPEEFTWIAEDAASDVIALDRRGGLWFSAGGSTAWTQIHGVNDTYELRALATTAEGQVLAAGTGGLVVLDGKDVKGLLNQTPAPAPLTSVLVAKSGRVWAGGEDGRLHSWTKAGGWQSFAIPEWDGGRIRSLGEDRRGRIWAGGDNGRVGFGNESLPFERWTPETGLKESAVTAIAGDDTGSVWFGFNGSGLQQWLGEAWTHRTFWRESRDLEAPIVFSVRGTADGGFVAAVFNRGVWRWDGHTMTAYGREQGITEDVRFAIEPEPGVIWAGTRFGLFEGRGGKFTRTLKLPTGSVSGIFHAPSGAWWATTTGNGVYVRNGNAWEPYAELNTQLEKFSANIRDILWRDNGDLWIASGRDLVSFHGGISSGGTRLSLPSGVTQPTALLERGREVWVGGVGGIAVFDGTSWRTIETQSGLPGNTMYSLAAGKDGSVWVGGAAGVSHLTGDIWTLYDASNALISEECNTFGLLARSSGEVLVGTMSGLAVFDPDMTPQPKMPLRLFWRTPLTGADNVVKVSASDRSINLEWSAPWPRPVEVEFRTRIVELTQSWSEPRVSSQLRVENLGAGTYTVQVAARFQRPGATDWTEPITATVIVAPRVWETWWARFAGFLLALGAVAGLIRWRTSRLAARARKLEMAVAEALSSAKVLRGLLPICAHCKKVRDDQGYWTRIEDYISRHSEADFSHGFCPECIEKHYAELNMKELD